MSDTPLTLRVTTQGNWVDVVTGDQYELAASAPPKRPSRADDEAAGRRLQAEAHHLMGARRAGLLVEIRRAMRDLYVRSRLPVSVDDVRDWLDLHHPNWGGTSKRHSWLATVFAGEDWQCVGYGRSTIISNRGRRVGLYAYTGHDGRGGR